jgi:hypothetical protein
VKHLTLMVLLLSILGWNDINPDDCIKDNCRYWTVNPNSIFNQFPTDSSGFLDGVVYLKSKDHLYEMVFDHGKIGYEINIFNKSKKKHIAKSLINHDQSINYKPHQIDANYIQKLIGNTRWHVSIYIVYKDGFKYQASYDTTGMDLRFITVDYFPRTERYSRIEQSCAQGRPEIFFNESGIPISGSFYRSYLPNKLSDTACVSNICIYNAEYYGSLFLRLNDIEQNFKAYCDTLNILKPVTAPVIRGNTMN